MNIWRIISPWIDKDYYAFTTLTLLISISIFYHHFTKDKFQNDQDLIRLEGKIIKYSFKHGSRGSRMYYLWLDNYRCTFQIPADYLHLFEENQFRQFVKKNDNLEIYISKSKQQNLQKDNKLFVLQIRDNYRIYLSKSDTIARELKTYDIYAGITFFFAGVMYYLIRRFLWKPKNLKY